MHQRRSRSKRIVAAVVAPIAVLALGGVGAALVFRLAPAVARAEVAPPPLLVEVTEVAETSATVMVEGTGTVVASKQVTVIPEVAGRVVHRNPSLLPGGRLEKGSVLLRIDPREYRLLVEQEEARVEAARVDLVVEEGRGRAAQREWAIVGDGRPAAEVPLAVRAPQLRAVRAQLRAAESALERARLNVARATIRTPWNAAVVSSAVEVGQVVGPGTNAAMLVATDEVWVRVSVPVRSLADLDVPGLGGDEGAPAIVLQEGASTAEQQWRGRVVRVETELDSETRTATLLVAVESPFDPPEGGLPLLPGSHVRVALEGRERPAVVRLPRTAVRGSSTVWVVDREEALAPRTVTIGWSTRDDAFVVDGLERGERVVTSALATPIAGQPVRVAADGAEGRRQGGRSL